MLRESSYYEFSLGAGDAVSLTRTAGWELLGVSGRVWLTEELGGRDVWLAAGERFRLSRPGRTVIEAAADGEGATVRMSLRRRWRVSTGGVNSAEAVLPYAAQPLVTYAT